jgi:Disulfide bond formation protein DsbB
MLASSRSCNDIATSSPGHGSPTLPSLPTYDGSGPTRGQGNAQAAPDGSLDSMQEPHVSTPAVTLFLALLTVCAQLAVALAVVLAVAGRASPAAARLRAGLAAAVTPQALPLAFVVALVAMLGSLWLSEGAHFTPCVLCWYQRAAMYPLAVILGVAAWRRDLGVRPYGLALAAVGLPISAYHYLLERFPALEAGTCDPDNPCTLLWVWRFHYISIPLMAGTAFALVAVLLLAARPASEPDRDEAPERDPGALTGAERASGGP